MPGDVAPLLHLGAIHQNHKLLEAAAAVYQRVIAIDPRHPVARERLADCLCEMGEFDQGMAVLEALHAEKPSAALQARIDFAFPCIPDSVSQIDAARGKLEAALDAYLASKEPVPPVFSPSFFYLAYQNRNDRDLQRKGALLARKSMPHLIFDAPWVAGYTGPGEKIRMGIASSLFYNHSIGRTTRGIVDRLDRARFEVVLVCLPPRRADAMAQAMRESADRVIDLVGDLTLDRETLAAQRFDVLFYPDIGMNSYQAMLAHARLAPLQCTHFGHPETNGIPTVDWWISVDALEPPDAAEHYSERLHLLRGVPQFSYYYRPPLPAPLKTRTDYGFGDDEHLLICPQYLFKVHPDFDPILERILREDPKARILFTRSPVAHWSEVILRRLERRMGRLVERITCLPGLAMPDLMNLERVCDAVLDTLHFNGYNTTLEAWSAGAPVVTMAGRFQRGMHTAGMYRFMGMEDLVAEDGADYVRLVRRLCEDAAFNQAMRREIAQRCDVLFENMDVVREYERFFEEKLRDRSWRTPQASRQVAEIASVKASTAGRQTAVAA
jgi:predicted O-linked N-acetylglucosamine transferase (SPINDLY family)